MRKVFSFTGAKKIVFGNGSFRALVSHIQELNAKNPLVVMDKNLAKAGFQEAVANLLVHRDFVLRDKSPALCETPETQVIGVRAVTAFYQKKEDRAQSPAA